MALYFFCGIIAILLLSLQTFYGVLLITPREVGGTLFGGLFQDFMYIGGWLIATTGLVVSVLLRFAGARLALLCASSMQVGVGIWSLINYPNDANGNLIFSPAPDEIHSMIAIAGSLLFISMYLIGEGYLKPRNTKHFPVIGASLHETSENDSL